MLTLTTMAAALASMPAQDDFDPGRCRVPADQGAIVLSIAGEPKVEAGETVELRPTYTSRPGAFDDLPMRCFSGWRVSDPKLARLSRDRKSVIVATDARAGATFTVSAAFGGRRISETFTIIVPVVSPLVGFWTQETVKACTDANRVFDLVFERSGDFAVAFGPTYHGGKDYRGKWRIEGDRLALADLTGERPADFVSDASFRIDANGGLTFDKPWLGTKGERGKCTAPFVKLR